MMLLGLVAAVLIPFAIFWFVGRRIEPKADGQQENVKEARSGRYG